MAKTNVLCTWINKLRSFLNRDFTVLRVLTYSIKLSIFNYLKGRRVVLTLPPAPVNLSDCLITVSSLFDFSFISLQLLTLDIALRVYLLSWPARSVIKISWCYVMFCLNSELLKKNWFDLTVFSSISSTFTDRHHRREIIADFAFRTGSSFAFFCYCQKLWTMPKRAWKNVWMN